MATSENWWAWSTTAADNATADSSINWAEGQDPGTVNNSARSLMAAVKKGLKVFTGNVTVGGTADAITITTGQSISSGHQALGFRFCFKAGSTNTGATTVNVDTLGTQAVKRPDGTALSAGDIVAGGFYDLAYDGTNYILLNGVNPTAIVTLAGTNAFTGTNTFSVAPRPSANDAAALGVSGTAWADLFLASGAVINFNAGDVTVTHAANTLTFAGASTGYVFDSTITATAGTFSSTLGVTGAATMSSTLTVTGAAALNGGITFSGVNPFSDSAYSDQILDALGSETTGALIYHNGTSWAVLAPP